MILTRLLISSGGLRVAISHVGVRSRAVGLGVKRRAIGKQGTCRSRSWRFDTIASGMALARRAEVKDVRTSGALPAAAGV